MHLVHSVTLQSILDLAGIFIFALSGGLVAVRKRLDLFGIILLSGMAGLGGGVVRDVLIGQVPPAGVSDPKLMGACALAGVCTFVASPEVSRITRTVRFLDAAGLALFCVTGTAKAFDYHSGATTAVFVGVVTAIGGGLMRDVIVGQVPEVLRRELYAIPAILGSTFVAVAYEMGHAEDWTLWAGIAVAFFSRIAAIILDLHAPQPLRTGDPHE